MQIDADFESPARGLRELGASAGERELVEWIVRHGREEGELLQRYEALADATASPSTRYLVGLIVEDERRHHRILAEIAQAIAWGIVPNSETTVPRPGRHEHDALVEETKVLLASEKRDRAELKRLHRRLSAYHDTLWPLLVEVMMADSEKHARILDFVVRQHAR